MKTSLSANAKEHYRERERELVFIVIIVIEEYVNPHKTLQHYIKSLQGTSPWINLHCRIIYLWNRLSYRNTSNLGLPVKGHHSNVLLSRIILYGFQTVTRSHLFMPRTGVFILVKYAKRLSSCSSSSLLSLAEISNVSISSVPNTKYI